MPNALSPMNINKLRTWFLKEKRVFPWRESLDPYAVWISEIMLQQTQASVVVPYFERWMKRFPDALSLASANKEDVVRAWEGLGYYSRARNLQRGAQEIVSRHGGVLPSSLEELLALPGIGDYTAGAILNFAFKKKAPAIDGNVTRVIARFFRLKKDTSLTLVKKEIRDHVEKILPEENPHVISEALIELGALICKKLPRCVDCPLKSECGAYQHGEELELPIQKKREKTVFIERIVIIASHQEKILVKKESEEKVMQDLYEFPFFEKKSSDAYSEARHFFEKELQIDGIFLGHLSLEKHSFTKYRVTLHPFLFKARHAIEVENCTWVPIDDLKNLPFSSGHRRLINKIL